MEPVPAFTSTVVVHIPPARAWALLTDWVAAPAWMPGVTEMHAEGPTQTGLVIDFHARGHERTAQVTALDPGRSITITTGEGDVGAHYAYGLAAAGLDTRLTLQVTVHVSDSLADMAGDVAASLVEADLPQLESFRRYAEAAP
jgi:uncharacterized protein YndB with AHSA1/START domain